MGMHQWIYRSRLYQIHFGGAPGWVPPLFIRVRLVECITPGGYALQDVRLRSHLDPVIVGIWLDTHQLSLTLTRVGGSPIR